jgi:formyltetrahydrofolate synthetase
MAKTHLSLSADPTLRNGPEDFKVTVRDVRAYTGAGWLVPLCGDITQMPGQPSEASRPRPTARSEAENLALLGPLGFSRANSLGAALR